MKKIFWVLIFVIFGFFLSRFLLDAQQESIKENSGNERILQKLEAILQEQSKIQEKLDKALNNQEEIKKELETIKVRSFRR